MIAVLQELKGKTELQERRVLKVKKARRDPLDQVENEDFKD